jgi:predicted RND superfamily exporter protein
MVHRYLAERGDVFRTLRGTGRSVVLTSLTTIAAFGTLAFSAHRGLASFASLITIGSVVALVLSVVVLPVLLRVFARAADASHASPAALAPSTPR